MICFGASGSNLLLKSGPDGLGNAGTRLFKAQIVPAVNIAYPATVAQVTAVATPAIVYVKATVLPMPAANKA